MLMTMLMSHASVDFFVLSFVLPCAYADVAGENQALKLPNCICYSDNHGRTPGELSDLRNFVPSKFVTHTGHARNHKYITHHVELCIHDSRL